MRSLFEWLLEIPGLDNWKKFGAPKFHACLDAVPPQFNFLRKAEEARRLQPIGSSNFLPRGALGHHNHRSCPEFFIAVEHLKKLIAAPPRQFEINKNQTGTRHLARREL